MVSWLGLLLALALAISPADSQGLVATLYDAINGPSGNVTAGTLVVTPSPIKGVSTPSPGCTNLPQGFVPRSGSFVWDSPSGTDTCSYFVFYRLQHCYPAGSGNETAIPASTTPSTFNDFSDHLARENATLATSVGCAYNFDPCVKYPCSDPNELCLSRSLIVYSTSQNKSFDQWVSRDCSTCREGCTRINGVCTCDPCSQLVCPSPGWCVASQGIASCKCPDDWTWDVNMKQCIYVGTQRWLTALNKERTNRGLAPLTWNTTLAEDAQAWAKELNSTLCLKWRAGEDIKLIQSNSSKLTPRRSENRAFNGYENTQAVAVSAWMQSGNAQVSRIIDTRTKQAGCGKAACNIWGAFFVCQFNPFTF